MPNSRSNFPKPLITPPPLGFATPSNPSSPSIATPLPVKKLTPQEMHVRREKGLCYNCDEVYSFGHRCKNKQVFLMVSDSGVSSDNFLDSTDSFVEAMEEVSDKSAEVAISINALSGTANFQTLRLKGTVKNNQITMLVDSGSTHNFLDSSTAQKLGCYLTDIPHHEVTVAGGGKLVCNKMCANFTWQIQGVKFTNDVRIISLGGCDLVLGVQWLKL